MVVIPAFLERDAALVVRASNHGGAMGLQIDPSWWTHFGSNQCSSTGTTKTMVCVILIVHIKDPLVLVSALCLGQ